MLRVILLVVIIASSINSEEIMNIDQVRTYIIDQLRSQSKNFTFHKWDDKYSFSGTINNVSVSICIENQYKEYQKYNKISLFDEYIKQIQMVGKEEEILKDKTKIFMQLQPHDLAIKDYIGYKFSDQTIAMAIYYDENRGSLTYLSSDMISKAGLTKEQIITLGNQNANRLVSELTIEENITDYGIIYTIITKMEFLKSSIIISDSFLEKIQKKVKHPNFIISNRDCMFIFEKENVELKNRLGSVCIKEYNNREYPVSCELFDVVDGKIKAIGAFQKKNTLPNK